MSHTFSISIISVTQSSPTLCDPMNHSMPGLPVHHQLLELTQTHVHGVSDAIQPSHSLSSPSPPAPNPSQHQSLFQWVNSWGGQSTAVSAFASFLPKKSQGWSPSEWTGWTSLQSKGLSRVFSNTTVLKRTQYFVSRGLSKAGGKGKDGNKEIRQKKATVISQVRDQGDRCDKKWLNQGCAYEKTVTSKFLT